MKKKIIVAVLIAVILALIPVPRTYKGAESDEGTKYYQALTYKIVKWNRKFYKDLVFNETVFYRFPFNFYSIDELWNGLCIDPAIEAEDETETTVAPSAEASSETEAKEKPSAEAQSEAVSDKKQSSEAETDISSTVKLPAETTKSGNKAEPSTAVVSDPKKNNDVILSSLNGDFENAHLDPESSAKIIEIVRNNRFNTPSYDNISDYKLIVNGVALYYDASAGILTAGAIKSENDNSKNAVKLSAKDKNTLNSIIAECERAYKLIYG